MFPEQLKKILNLIKKTGDRVIIFDGSAPEDSYVIMDFDKYAETAGSKSENKVAASVPISNPGKPDLDKLSPDKPENSGNSAKNDNLTEEDLTDKINREILMWKNQDNVPYLGDENKPKKPWQIPSQVKEKA